MHRFELKSKRQDLTPVNNLSKHGPSKQKNRARKIRALADILKYFLPIKL